MTAIDYTIEPIEGRAAIQRNFVKLPERASNYSNRHVTLNERFSIIERGYYLKPKELATASRPPRVYVVPVSATSSKDIMTACLAKMERRHLDAQRKQAKSQQSSPCTSPPKSMSSESA
uniref:DDA1 domain-containing protein n=1 Tax=Haemonchus contortus TaxID=6289 RepID=A0A7I4YFI7_HAECO|nr:hypothetical protein HCOI_02097300 [Haemonchus contortus]